MLCARLQAGGGFYAYDDSCFLLGYCNRIALGHAQRVEYVASMSV